jgi:hypothetical protein
MFCSVMKAPLPHPWQPHVCQSLKTGYPGSCKGVTFTIGGKGVALAVVVRQHNDKGHSLQQVRQEAQAGGRVTQHNLEDLGHFEDRGAKDNAQPQGLGDKESQAGQVLEIQIQQRLGTLGPHQRRQNSGMERLLYHVKRRVSHFLNFFLESKLIPHSTGDLIGIFQVQKI